MEIVATIAVWSFIVFLGLFVLKFSYIIASELNCLVICIPLIITLIFALAFAEMMYKRMCPTSTDDMKLISQMHLIGNFYIVEMPFEKKTDND